MTLRFSDGEEFNTRETLHVQCRADGWYVVGDGMLIPVAGVREAQELLRSLQAARGRTETVAISADR